MEHAVSRTRARMAIAVVMLLVASALLAAQAKPADATTLARVPASLFAQVADEVHAPTIVGGWFANYDGVDGESNDAGHNNWVDIVSIDWGANKPGAGNGNSRRRGSAQVRDFVIQFDYEKASVKLLEKLLRGEVIPKLEVELTVSFDGQRLTYLKYEMKNVQVVSYDVGGVADGTQPLVTVANNFEEIKVTYSEYDEKGSLAGNVETSWKRETAK
ncbi:MAG: type VI secretion system tube protein Hcp [Acidimicrobiia bacterium]|nr:type VI secretion system tube protein Hcp [Acidimicrobiia bacterium]